MKKKKAFAFQNADTMLIMIIININVFVMKDMNKFMENVKKRRKDVLLILVSKLGQENVFVGMVSRWKTINVSQFVLKVMN